MPSYRHHITFQEAGLSMCAKFAVSFRNAKHNYYNVLNLLKSILFDFDLSIIEKLIHKQFAVEKVLKTPEKLVIHK